MKVEKPQYNWNTLTSLPAGGDDFGCFGQHPWPDTALTESTIHLVIPRCICSTLVDGEVQEEQGGLSQGLHLLRGPGSLLTHQLVITCRSLCQAR